jgi:NADPH-dependent 7-cyano-7-deazaguanine reductase QueF
LGFFERPEQRRYRFGVVHDSESYLRLLGSFSGHRALDERTRKRLFAAVARLIDEEYGDCVVEGYRSELYVARRR